MENLTGISDYHYGLQKIFPAAEDFLQDAARSGDCHCIVIDVHLPGMSGLELQQELKRRAVVPTVIVMTAFEDPDLRRRATDAGAVAFLKKPFDESVLLDAVTRACGSVAND